MSYQYLYNSQSLSSQWHFPPPVDLGIARVSQGSCGCFSEAQSISPPEKKGLSNLLSPRFAQSPLPRNAMPCKSFLANGTETDLEKQLPLCNEKKSPPAYSFSFLAGVLWKQSKNGICRRGGCRGGMNTPGWCTGCTGSTLPMLLQVASCSPGQAMAIGTE